MSASKERRARMSVRVFRSLADQQAHDRAYWAALPVSTRVEQVWALSEEQWRLRGEFPDEPGLCRLLRAFVAHDVRFLVVGAYAMAAHGVPRATGDLDVWIDPTEENAPRVFTALVRFGAPLRALGVRLEDFAAPGAVCQIGLPPRRIDVTTLIDGVAFAEAWAGRLEGSLGAVPVSYIGRDALLRNKEAARRAKDLADLELLRSAPRQK